MIKTRGIVVPVDWNEDGGAVSFAVSTFNEDEYVLDCGLSTEEMTQMIHEVVEVCGELRIENGKKTISVVKISNRKQPVS